MQLSKKYLFMFVGVGLVLSGIAITFFVIPSAILPISVTDNDAFILQKVEAAHKGLVRHDHMTLGLVKNRQQIEVPENIGISAQLWKDHSLDSFSNGIAPLHTHDTTGRIHIESTVHRDFTFGEFLDIWGIDRTKIVRVVDIEGNEIRDYEHFVLVPEAILIMEITD